MKTLELSKHDKITIEAVGMVDHRTVYRYRIQGEGVDYTAQDLKSGCGGGTEAEGLASLLAFLGHDTEYGLDIPGATEEDLADFELCFPVDVALWAYHWSEELAMAQLELEEE